MPTAFVLLASHLDAEEWRSWFEQGFVADATPYGYHHAEELGWKVRFSQRKGGQHARRHSILQRAVRGILGFDLVHAWRNRSRWREADVVWTHTEREHLAFLLAARLSGRRHRCPGVIAQSVWLLDVWDRLPRWRRALYRSLMARADVLTTLSAENARLLRELVPGPRVEFVKFGVSPESFPVRAPSWSGFRRPLRVFAAGNDRHRDWDTLGTALQDGDDMELKVASRKFPQRYVRPGIEAEPTHHDGMEKLYEWCDVVVVPLKHNLHASGISVVLEAVAVGKPLVVTNTGCIDAYFDDSEVTYVPVGDAGALRRVLADVAEDPATARQKALRAQERFLREDYSTRGYAARHVKLSRELLESRSERPEPA